MQSYVPDLLKENINNEIIVLHLNNVILIYLRCYILKSQTYYLNLLKVDLNKVFELDIEGKNLLD